MATDSQPHKRISHNRGEDPVEGPSVPHGATGGLGRGSLLGGDKSRCSDLHESLLAETAAVGLSLLL